MDARILGQLLAAQNVLFALPDEARIAQYLSQALGSVPGAISCFVCLGGALPAGKAGEACGACALRQERKEETPFAPDAVSCGLAVGREMQAISVGTRERTYGFFIFRIDATAAFEPYLPFLHNLANYVALSLENRTQKRLLEKARDESEQKVRELQRMNKLFVGRELRMKELKERVKELEKSQE